MVPARRLHEELNEGGEAELARFQDQVAFMQPIQQLRLRPIQFKGDQLARFGLAGVEVIQPPASIH